MSIELLHTGSDTEQFEEWLVQSALASGVPLQLDDTDTITHLAGLLRPTGS